MRVKVTQAKRGVGEDAGFLDGVIERHLFCTQSETYSEGALSKDSPVECTGASVGIVNTAVALRCSKSRG